MRKVHFTRAVDIAFGSWLNGTKTNLRQLAYRKLLDVKDGQMALNAFIRDNTPAFYVVNVPLIVRTALNSIIEDKRFVSKITSPEGVLDFGQEGFDSGISSRLLSPKVEKDLISKILVTLKSDLKEVTSATFYKAVEKVHKEFVEIAESLNSKNSGYLSYKIAASKAGQKLRIELNKIGTAVLKDPRAMVNNLPSDSLVVVAPTFTIGVANTNKIIDQVLAEYFEGLGVYLNKIDSKQKKVTSDRRNFNVGNVVHAGHTAVSEQGKQVGINTPGILINGLISRRFSELEKAVGSLPEHIEYKVDFNPNYSSSGVLLDMQFNIAVSMPATLNSGILSVKEVAAIKKTIEGAALLELKEAVKQSFKAEVIDSLDFPALSASPNILEFIEDSIRATIKGEKPISVKSKNSTRVKKVSLPKQSAPTTKLASGGKISTKKVGLPPKATPPSGGLPASLSSLQLLFNNNLREYIVKNMGTGNSKRVLNYRTGRFADSVKIERLSANREGAITAFYSYMRNPYATFSEGGAQQYPKTRDPKLLISKSIRELAAKNAYNILRSINV